jgi:Transglycosylase SLT domain
MAKMWGLILKLGSLFGLGYFVTSQVKKDDPNFISLTPVGDVNTWKANAKKMDARFFNGWFSNNGYIDLVAAMVMAESSGGRNLVREVSVRDTSYGPMQVTLYTARDIYERGGYRNYSPTRTVLLTPIGGMYFGMAYIKMLHNLYGFRKYSDITRAYNGGPNFTGNTARAAQTLAHWNKVNSYIA